MKWVYRLVLDTGTHETITAESKSKAIDAYCKQHGVSRMWMLEHCRVLNCGRVE